MGNGVNPNEIIMVDDPIDGTIRDGRNGGRRARGRLAGGVRDKLTMAEMKARMSALWKDNVMYKDIAEKVSDEFGLQGSERFNANAIHYHIKEMQSYWRTMSLLHADEKMALILARYDQLESICMEAYFASCSGKATTMYEKQSERARSKDRENLLREQIKEERERRREALHGNKKDNPKHELEFAFTEGELVEMMVDTAEKIKEYTRHEESLAGDPKWVRMLIDINDKRASLWGFKNRKPVDNEDQEFAKLSDEQRDQRLIAVIGAARQRREERLNMLGPEAPLNGWEDGEMPQELVDDMPNLASEGPMEAEVLPPEVDEDEYEVSEVDPDVEDSFEFDFSDLEGE